MGAENVAELPRVAPGDIARCESQPRKYFDPDSLADLADSMLSRGQLQPIGVRMCEGGKLARYELVYGERRWRAARLIVRGYVSRVHGEVKALPGFQLECVVRETPASDCDLLLDQLVENLVREDMRYLEEAEAFGRLRDEGGLSIGDISKRGIPKSRVSKRLSLLRLPAAWRERLDAGNLPLWAAQLALMVGDEVASQVPGKSALEDALEVCAAARNMGAARVQLDRRYLRPARELAAWTGPGMTSERERVYADFCERVLSVQPTEEPVVLDYETCRKVFPFDSEGELWAINGGDYCLASDFPGPGDGLIRGADVGCWGEMSAFYEVPLFLCLDGLNTVRVLVNRVLVLEGARLASPAAAEAVFASSVDGGRSEVAQQTDLVRAEERAEDVAAVSRLAEMIGRLDARIRERYAETGKVNGEFFWGALLFCGEAGALGVSGKEFPLRLAMGAMAVAPGDELFFGEWPGVFDSEGYEVEDPGAGLEALYVCGQVAYFLTQELEAGRDFAECGLWRDVCEGYGVLSD